MVVVTTFCHSPSVCVYRSTVMHDMLTVFRISNCESRGTYSFVLLLVWYVVCIGELLVRIFLCDVTTYWQQNCAFRSTSGGFALSFCHSWILEFQHKCSQNFSLFFPFGSSTLWFFGCALPCLVNAGVTYFFYVPCIMQQFGNEPTRCTNSCN